MNLYNYEVYENDLKFKNKREIDPARAKWDNNVKDKYYNNDLDTLEYRLNECENNNFVYLDLSHLDLLILPKSQLLKWSHVNKLKYIKYLFINDNKLVKIDNTFDIFNNLEVLDISNNNLSDILYLPLYLKELSCHNNILNNIPFHKYLHRLDCSLNKIYELSQYPNIKTILCYDNNITKLHTYPNATTIICRNNNIININPQPCLTYLDCSHTKLTGSLYDMPNINHLVCNNTKINNIDNLNKLKILDIANSDITAIPYIHTLKNLSISISDLKQIILSPTYVIANYNTEHNNVYIKFT
jgi:hypothetical protein